AMQHNMAPPRADAGPGKGAGAGSDAVYHDFLGNSWAQLVTHKLVLRPERDDLFSGYFSSARVAPPGHGRGAGGSGPDPGFSTASESLAALPGRLLDRLFQYTLTVAGVEPVSLPPPISSLFGSAGYGSGPGPGG